MGMMYLQMGHSFKRNSKKINMVGRVFYQIFQFCFMLGRNRILKYIKIQ